MLRFTRAETQGLCQTGTLSDQGFSRPLSQAGHLSSQQHNSLWNCTEVDRQEHRVERRLAAISIRVKC
jgi:hypothetical protein